MKEKVGNPCLEGRERIEEGEEATHGGRQVATVVWVVGGGGGGGRRGRREEAIKVEVTCATKSHFRKRIDFRKGGKNEAGENFFILSKLMGK